MEKNHEKAGEYAKNKRKLSNALKSGYYFESIFIEYSILEDRTLSLLSHAGNIKLIDSQNHNLKLSAKLNKLETHKAFVTPTIRKRLPIEFIKEIREWKEKRDVLVHNLFDDKAVDEEIKQLALEGKRLVDQLDNKTKSIKRIFDKQNAKE